MAEGRVIEVSGLAGGVETAADRPSRGSHEPIGAVVESEPGEVIGDGEDAAPGVSAFPGRARGPDGFVEGRRATFHDGESVVVHGVS